MDGPPSPKLRRPPVLTKLFEELQVGTQLEAKPNQTLPDKNKWPVDKRNLSRKPGRLFQLQGIQFDKYYIKPHQRV